MKQSRERRFGWIGAAFLMATGWSLTATDAEAQNNRRMSAARQPSQQTVLFQEWSRATRLCRGDGQVSGLAAAQSALVNFAVERALEPPRWTAGDVDGFNVGLEAWLDQQGGAQSELAQSLIPVLIPAFYQGASPGAEYYSAEAIRLMQEPQAALPFAYRAMNGQARLVLLRPEGLTVLSRWDVIETIGGQAVATDDRGSSCKTEALEAGTVAITGRRAATGEPFSVEVEAAFEACPDFEVDTRDRAAVVTVANFTNEGSVNQLVNQLREIPRGEISRGIVLDLRMSSGGLLSEMINLLDLFLPGGQVFSVVEGGPCTAENDWRERYFAISEQSALQPDPFRVWLEQVPLSVLVGPETARGATVAAAVLQERNRAKLLGQPVQGDGLVHTVIPLVAQQAGAIKLATGQLHTPSDRRVSELAIFPEIAAPGLGEDWQAGIDLAIAALEVR